MTEGFRPPASPSGRSGWADTAATREQEVNETVRRIMTDDVAPAPRPIIPRADEAAGASTTEVARQQTADVADTTKQAAAQVVDTAKEQAGQVTQEATQQAKQLIGQVQSELSAQAASTQVRVAEGLHALADELSGMARNSDQDGVATDLARQAADKARSAAGWLADRDPGSLLDEVRSFARNKPGTYLALALGAGVVAGRLTRGLTAPVEDHATPESRPAASIAAPRNRLDDGRAPLPAAAVTSAVPVYDEFPPTGLETSGTVAARGDVAP
jgi:hypothetical protein